MRFQSYCLCWLYSRQGGCVGGVGCTLYYTIGKYMKHPHQQVLKGFDLIPLFPQDVSNIVHGFHKGEVSRLTSHSSITTCKLSCKTSAQCFQE